MRALLQDLRYGLRTMRASAGLTAVAVLSLALGIGANTAIFTFINALILRALPVQDPQALVLFGPGDAQGNSGGFPDDDMNLFSYPMYREFQQKNHVFSGVAEVRSFDAGLHGTVGSGGGLESMTLQLVSGTYFNVLGVKAVVGRVLTDADDRNLGGHPVAVISYGWWTSRFSRDASIVGKTLTIEGTVYTIVGVAPPGFFGISVGDSPDFWVPLQMEEQISRGPHKLNDHFYMAMNIIARLKPGVSLPQAAADVNLVLKDMLQEYAGSKPTEEQIKSIRGAHVTLRSAANGVSPGLRDRFQSPLWMLMGIVGVVLLIACANIANLLLARGANRHREIAVRMAMGAKRARLIRQMLTESLLLAAAGGLLGILFASWSGRLLLSVVSTGTAIIPLDVQPDARVLAFTLLLSVVTALLFGVLPALRATRLELTRSLKEGRGALAAQARNPIAKALIVSQVALSVVLLLGAGLFVRTLINLANVNTGFDRHGVLQIALDPSATGFTKEAQLFSLYRQVEDRVEALPGVRAASFSIFTFNQGGWTDQASPEGGTQPSGYDRDVSLNAVGPGYFAAMGLPILAGRGIGPQDTESAPRVAVINRTMAQRFFGKTSPIGKRFGTGDRQHSHDIQVIGVVSDAKYQFLDEKPTAMAYFSYPQYVPDWGIGLFLGHLSVRFSGDPGTVSAGVRRAVSEINASLPITSIQTLEQRVDDSILYQRLIAQLSAFFGALAVFLACIGIFGLMSYSVSRRTNEIGVRMALGAGQHDVVRMVMREIVALIGAGVALGVPLALWSGRWASSMLFGLKPTDPATISLAVVLLLAVAALAGYLPARRASKVDPMVALRYE